MCTCVRHSCDFTGINKCFMMGTVTLPVPRNLQAGLCEGLSLGYLLQGCWLCLAMIENPEGVLCLEVEEEAPKEEEERQEINPSQFCLYFESKCYVDSNRKEAHVFSEVRFCLPSNHIW